MNRPQMLELWNLLLQSWGQKFAEQYGTSPNDAWQGMLAHVNPESAKHAFRKALLETPTFPPTLGEFLAWSQEFRPASGKELPNPKPTYSDRPTDELRREASAEVSAFNTYRDYERWRDAHTVKGKRPAHPEPGSADWLYLSRLAWIEAAENNRRTTASLHPAA